MLFYALFYININEVKFVLVDPKKLNYLYNKIEKTLSKLPDSDNTIIINNRRSLIPKFIM